MITNRYPGARPGEMEYMGKLIFQGYEYIKILKSDCIVVHLTNKAGGEYYTSLPVSTHSKVEIIEGKKFVSFKITDDWGKVRLFDIPIRMQNEINIAKEAAAKINSRSTRNIPTHSTCSSKVI